MITNDLFPEGIPMRGSYTGSFDEATGRAVVQSHSLDYVFPTRTLQLFPSTSEWLLGWSLKGSLETALNVMGPWTTLSNAVSPHPVNSKQERQQFFRVRAAP